MPRREPLNSASYQERISRANVLRRLPIFWEIAEKLAEGSTIESVALWAVGRCPDLPCGQWSPNYWRRMLYQARPVIQREIDRAKARNRHREVTDPQFISEVSQGIEEATGRAIRQFIPEQNLKLWDALDEIIKLRNVIKLLYFLWMQSEPRLGELRNLEKNNGFAIPLPETTRTIDCMRKLAVEINKCEIRIETLKLKFKELDMKINANSPVIAGENKPLSPLAQELAQFDEVDRNLFREAGLLCLDMAKDAATGVFELNGLGPDPGTDQRATDETRAGNGRQDVPGGP